MAECRCEDGKIFRFGCPIHADPELPAREVRISLSREDFRTLVRGNIVEMSTPYGVVKVALSDIGWPIMIDEINKAWSERR